MAIYLYGHVISGYNIIILTWLFYMSMEYGYIFLWLHDVSIIYDCITWVCHMSLCNMDVSILLHHMWL